MSFPAASRVQATLTFSIFQDVPWTSQVSLVVRNPLASAGDVRGVGLIPGLGRSPGGGNATQSSILAWSIPWIEEPGRLPSMGSQSQAWLKWLNTHTQDVTLVCLASHGLFLELQLWLSLNIFSFPLVSPVAQWWRIHLQCRRYRRCGFDLCVWKIPWRRAWQSIPGLLAGESHGQRSLVGSIQRVVKSQTRLSWLSMHTPGGFLRCS